jgi:MFS family permease
VLENQSNRMAGAAMASLALCMLLPSLGTSIANVALPTLATSLSASFQQVQWVVLAYLLATTTLIVGAGRLGDMLGRRRLLAGGIVLFTAASVLCGMAPSLWVLLVGRAAQGAGAAVMLALTLAMVGEAVPKARIGSAIGMLGTLSAVGTALGPSLGGLLIAGCGWRAIFLVNAPLGLVALTLALRSLPADRTGESERRASFDVSGMVVLAISLAAYALAMTIGREHFGVLNLALLAASSIGAAVFLRMQEQGAAPLLDLARLREPRIAAGLAVSALIATVMMATLIVGPFHLAEGLGLSTTKVGFVMSVGPMVAALAGIPAGRLVDHIGAQRMTCAGLAGMLAGSAALGIVPASLGIAGYVLPSMVLTGSYALLQTANNTAVMRDVAADQRGVVSGLLNLSRNLGLITGAAVLGAVFAWASRASAADTRAQAVVSGMHATFAVASVLVAMALLVALLARRAGASGPSHEGALS